MRYWEESLPEGRWRGHGPPSRTAQLMTSQLNSKDELSVHHPERVGLSCGTDKKSELMQKNLAKYWGLLLFLQGKDVHQYRHMR